MFQYPWVIIAFTDALTPPIPPPPRKNLIMSLMKPDLKFITDFFKTLFITPVRSPVLHYKTMVYVSRVLFGCLGVSKFRVPIIECHCLSEPDKTKYMRFAASPSRRSVKGATINGVTYEGVAEFIYLGTLISNDNSVEKEIQKRILAGNRTYFAAISLFRSRLLSRATKIILYKTLIRPVVLCGAEAWTVTKKEQALQIFERTIFRRIYGAKYGNGEWKSRTSRELEEMSKGENTVKWIKGRRISWLGHLERMEEDRMPKKIFTQELEATKRRERPRKRWKEEVERDLQVLGVRRWRELIADREKWRHCSTDQSHSGL